MIKWILSKKVLIVLLGIIGIYFACINITVSGIWLPIKYLPNVFYNHIGVLRAFGIGLCLICICEFPFAQKILSLKPLKWMGKISAYTYAFHWPITLSLGCGLYLLLAKTSLPYQITVLFISLSVLVATFILAFLYTKLIPQMNKAEGWIMNKIMSLFKKEKKKEN